MIEHPVPQNITAYQFHLIGNMTVKQFLMLLAGAGLGFLFYTTNLPGLLKWSLIIFFFGGAAAAAFVPYEDRTLDQWLINFIRAIYRPTKYYWRRQPKIPNFLSYQPLTSTDDSPKVSSWAPQKRQKVQAYLSSLQSGSLQEETDPLDVFTRSGSRMTDLFDQVQAANNVNPGDDQFAARPNLKVRTRPLRKPQEVFRAGSPGAVIAATAKSAQLAAKQAGRSHHPSRTVSAVHQAKAAAAPVDQGSISTSQIRTAKSTQTIKVATVSTEQAGIGSIQSETIGPADNGEQPYVSAEQLASSSMGKNQILPAVFDRNLPFPSLPTQPNMLVGMVHDSQAKIIPNAIIEILDEKGNTVRAMKTNTLGQFYISSALKPGTYRLETEKEGLTFPIYELTVNNEILEPINIQAQQ